MNNKISILLLIISFLIPIVGIIAYFVKKSEENAGAYLGAGIAGFILNLLLLI